ncbi:PLP-dependent aminotransferase family protein [Pelagibius marinus]|uniref:aminotransferase-like domain-containing protein n=1 Tax=Pelagibius marinus TaxID=2762760 RepID=UPI0018733C04|nr:PLP-dependent aminotransferase family protein [Pelagibius marinus]
MFQRIEISQGDLPIYQQLAEVIAGKIASGELVPGDRLPPQRDIARMAGVNLTTVTRAFATLQQRGLVESRPGRGSIVARPATTASFKSSPSEAPGFTDLSVNRPATPAYLGVLAKLLPQLPADPRYSALQDFHAPEGPDWAREALAQWLAPAVGAAEPARVMVTNGAQHGLACVLGAIARPGETVLADAVTYQGIGALCRSLELPLKAVAMDAGGMRPDVFEAVCATQAPRAVFLVPNLHNPTAITLDAGRRRAIAEIARRHAVTIIEDDVYRPLADDPPPTFVSSDPDITIHVSGFSKCVAPGLRLGAVVAPPRLLDDIAAMLRINCWSTGALTNLVATRMIEDGSVDSVIAEQKAELRLRQAIIAEVLAGYELTASPTSTHAWLSLPEPWHGNAFASAAQRAGVGVLPGEAFAIGRDLLPHAVRINAGAARSREELRRALEILHSLLVDGHLHVDAKV